MKQLANIELHPTQEVEIELFKRSMNSVLKDMDYDHWTQLTEEERMFAIEETKKLVEEVMPEEDRHYSLIYTRKETGLEMMALPKTELTKNKL